MFSFIFTFARLCQQVELVVSPPSGFHNKARFWNIKYCFAQLLLNLSSNFLQFFLQLFCSPYLQRKLFSSSSPCLLYVHLYLFHPLNNVMEQSWFLPENIDIKFASCCTLLPLHNTPSPASGEPGIYIQGLLQNEK